MLNPPKFIYRNGKPEIGNLTEITSRLVVILCDPKTEIGKVVGCVTAIDFKKKTVTYMHRVEGVLPENPRHLETDNAKFEERTETGDIFLFVDKDKFRNTKTTVKRA
jgi:hypothetical protein